MAVGEIIPKSVKQIEPIVKQTGFIEMKFHRIIEKEDKHLCGK